MIPPAGSSTESQHRRVIVLGAGGMLGRAVVEEFRAAGDDVQAFTRSDLDITNAEHLETRLPGSAVVINCAAYTDVDGAEANEEAATLLNGTAVGELARRCREAGSFLVHYSTDYVFNGEATSPYPIDAPRAPINAYGRSKARGEELLEQSGCEHLLIRTSWVYAPWGKNFVTTMACLMKERDVVRVVDDQRGRPTSALWLAEVTRRLLDAGAAGTFHVTDDGECTWYEFAKCVAEVTGATCRVEPCSSEEFPRPAKRPRYSVLGLERVVGTVGVMKPARAALAATIAGQPI